MNSLEDVRKGMRVVDPDGEDLGTVKFVKMGNPDATTAEGQSTGEAHGLIDSLVDAVAGPDDPPEEAQERLLRLGYIDVDAAGLRRDFSVAADAVAEVADDTVHLNTRPA